MKYLSLFSGIEAATAAWHDWGWECVGVSEIDAFPCEVLKQRYPHIPNLGDITKITQEKLDELGTVDIVVGGSPCQSFSIAGKREGLEDPRGKLMLEYIRVVGAVRPKWFIWENVPGVLSSDNGRAFGTLIRQMADIGYSLCWRVLDAQHFGVPQRRRRVFLVGHLGTDRECAAKVLFDPYCLSRNFAKSTQKKKKAATNDGSCLASGNQTAGTILGEHGRLQFADNQSAFTGNFHVLENVDRRQVMMIGSTQINAGIVENAAVSYTLTASMGTGGGHVPMIISPAYNSVNENVDKLQLSRLNHHIINGRQEPITSSVAQPLTTDTSGLDNVFCDVYNGSISDVAPTMTTATGITNGSGPKLLQAPYTQSGFASYSQGFGTLTATDHKRPHDNIRRLTPVECERLQGFPDNHTRIKWRGKDENKCPDGHRYKALGNSMAVPVMRWIGHNIQQYDERYYLPW